MRAKSRLTGVVLIGLIFGLLYGCGDKEEPATDSLPVRVEEQDKEQDEEQDVMEEATLEPNEEPTKASSDDWKQIYDGKFGKTLPERLFMMSAKEYIDMTLEDFASMLNEEDVLYQQEEYNVIPLTTDSFMGYDCIYAYGKHDDDIGATPSDVASFSDSSYFCIAFDTEDDFKEGQKSLKKYLEKSLVNNSSVLKTNGGFFSGDTYLVECSNQNLDSFWERVSYSEDNWYPAEETPEGNISQERIYEEEDFNSMDYKLYKFVQVCYPQMDEETRALFPSDKSYTDFVCYIQVTCIPMTEEQYIAFAGRWGYDAISHKDIDLSEFEADIDTSGWQYEYIRLPWQESGAEIEDSVKFILYFMQEYNFDLLSERYLKDDAEKKNWYAALEETIGLPEEVQAVNQ